jgi:hypothetical protein
MSAVEQPRSVLDEIGKDSATGRKRPKYLAELLPKLPLSASTELKFVKSDHSKLSFS